MEDFVAREMAIYKEQLQRYEKLMSAVESLPIKTALYLVSIGTLIETA
jgi:ATP-dependent helicase/nuclease subunit A